jgi:paraquat-inducible protein A
MTHPLTAMPLTCPMCGLVQTVSQPPRGHEAACGRCGWTLLRHSAHGVDRTLAFSLAALLMYAPANLLPIMSFEYYGAAEPTTVWGGVVSLVESNMYFVAAVVFLASVVVPLLKLAALFFLCLTLKSGGSPVWKTRLYRIIRAVGTWAMLDVFLLALLVGVVKLGQLANVRPGPAALPFTLVVVLTILATESFDPSLLWKKNS